MKLCSLFLFLALTSVATILSTNNEINLVYDVIQSYDKPTSVAAMVSWNIKDKFNLTVRLRNGDKPKTIRFVRETTKTYNLASKDVVVVMDLSCRHIGDVLKKANNAKMFRNYKRWLFLGVSSSQNSEVPTEFDNLNILTDSEVIISRKSTELSGNSYELFLVYKIAPQSKWSTEYFGNWTTTHGLCISKNMEISIHMRRKNLSKHPVSTSFAIIDNKTKYDLADLRNPSVDTLTKCSYRVAAPMYEFLNATRVELFTDTWGYLINSSWNGMVKQIVRGEAEFAGTVMFITEDRQREVHYLTSPINSNVFFVFREPPLSYQNNLFLLPFRATVWACTLSLAVILLFVIYINARWDARKSENVDTDEKPNVSDVAMMIVGAISQQGSVLEFKGARGRLMTFILFLTFLFMYTSYSASIIVLLQSSSDQIRTLSDLLNSKLELGVEDTPYNRHYFTSATDPVRRAIYQTKIAPPGSISNFMSLEEGIRRLQKTPFAFNMNTGAGYRIIQSYFFEHEKCGLHTIGFVPPYRPWLSCKKDSPYKDMFQISLYRIQEHGLSDREYHLLNTKKPECVVHGGSFVSVSVIDMYPALLMLLYGFILALTVFAMELLVYRRRNAKRDVLRESSAYESSYT